MERLPLSTEYHHIVDARRGQSEGVARVVLLVVHVSRRLQRSHVEKVAFGR